MSNEIQISVDEVASVLSTGDYNRQRVGPLPKDEFYIHLADLLVFLMPYAKSASGVVLDYGCGGSPYRELFQCSEYLRADYVDCGGINIIIGQDGKMDLPDCSCDMILSTQVLEHVFSPDDYLAEAFRVLRPGGKLILTTHGIWEDHGCPYDFWRWTADGLRRLLDDSSFESTRIVKITTGPRAVFFMFFQMLPKLSFSRRTVAGLAFWLLRRSSLGKAESRHKWMDRYFPDHRLVSSEAAGHATYLALGVETIKPLGKG